MGRGGEEEEEAEPAEAVDMPADEEDTAGVPQEDVEEEEEHVAVVVATEGVDPEDAERAEAITCWCFHL